MRLKRGVERGSCDFCHRRKIKCDRSTRANQGHSACSQCALREQDCHLDDSEDIRIRRRRQADRNIGAHDVSAQEQGRRDVIAREDLQWALGIDQNAKICDTSPNRQLEGSAGQHNNLMSPAASLSTSHIINAPNSSTDHTSFPFLLDSPFDLCSDSIFFLDQVFVTDNESPLWSNPSSIMPNEEDAPSAECAQVDDESQYHPAIAAPIEDSGLCKYWQGCGLDQTAFTGALHAYFDLAALCLPVVLEDAFWQDYGAGRCSDALIYAIACRGIPFTGVADKWTIQQRLASKFKDVFFEAQHSISSGGPIRLDDLEALALMAHFEYNEEPNFSLHSNLEKLYLTHDSLVLMTLQSQIHGHTLETPDSSILISRANERRTLLFWHVFGLDAFHCLDCKSMSRISDDDRLADKLPHDQEGGYLDAILRLSIVARRMIHVLCNPRARQKGIRPNDVLSLYDQLSHWHYKGCPVYLQKQPDNITGETSTSIPASNTVRLHRAVLGLLEANLYMQIESHAGQYGIADENTFDSEIVAHRIEFETLRAAREVVEISHWIRRQDVQGADDTRHSFVDLAPSILRNICAGICFWTCTHSKEMLRCHPHHIVRIRLIPSQSSTQARSEDSTERVRKYQQGARRLREAVATATSHKDTSKVLDRLDKQLNSLDIDLQSSQPIVS